jgi:hypothetical protein
MTMNVTTTWTLFARIVRHIVAVVRRSVWRALSIVSTGHPIRDRPVRFWQRLRVWHDEQTRLQTRFPVNESSCKSQWYHTIRFIGGKYQMSQLIAHDVIICNRCCTYDCSLLFQNGSPSRESYFIAIGYIVLPIWKIYNFVIKLCTNLERSLLEHHHRCVVDARSFGKY